MNPSDISITRIPVEHVSDYWDQVSLLLKKGVDESGGRYDLASLYSQIVQGEQQLWVVFAVSNEIVAAVTTQFCVYPLKTNLSVVFCGSNETMGGTSGNWKKAMSDLIDWARHLNCDSIEFDGRRGWLKVFKSLGFRESYVAIERQVGE